MELLPLYSQPSNFGHPSCFSFWTFLLGPAFSCICSRNLVRRVPSCTKSNLPNVSPRFYSVIYKTQNLSKTYSKHPPGWTGFRKIVPIKVTSPTTFGNCQSIPAAPTDINVVYNMMINIQKILANLSQTAPCIFLGRPSTN